MSEFGLTDLKHFNMMKEMCFKVLKNSTEWKKVVFQLEVNVKLHVKVSSSCV